MKLRERGAMAAYVKLDTPSQHKMTHACGDGAIRGKGKLEKKKSKTGKQE